MSALSKIKRIILFEMILIFFSSVVMSETAEKTNVALRTSQGDIIIELYSDKAPVTVTNFLRHLDEGFYDGLHTNSLGADYIANYLKVKLKTKKP